GLALVLLGALAAGRARRRMPVALRGTERPNEVLEYSLVCILMLLLSPQSSKPHFCTLLLPGFCLARLVIQHREPVLGVLLCAAIGAGLLSNKDLVGGAIYEVAIWYGSVFWNTALLFIGC